MLSTSEWRSPVEVSVAMFCPYCGLELYRDDVLGQIESANQPRRTIEEVRERGL